MKRLALALLLLTTLLLAGCAGAAPVSLPDATAPTLAPTVAADEPAAELPTVTPEATVATPAEAAAPTVAATPTLEPAAWTSHSNLDDVQDIFQDSDGRVWAATTGGAVIWDFETGTYTMLRVAEGLPANDVRAVAQTPDGAIWIGTAAGLARYEEGHIVGSLGSAVLGSADVQALLVDSQGRLWVGTEGAGAVRYDGETWQPLHFSTEAEANSVYSIYEDAEGRLWFGGLGLARLDGETWQVFDDKPVSGRGVLAISEDSAGTLWFGTPFDVARYADETFTTLNYPKQAAYAIGDIWEDAQHRLWLGTEKGGIWIIDNGQWQQLTAQDGLPATSVRRFLKLRNGTLLLATDQGIYEQLTDGWRPYLVGGGPAGNDIRAVLLDANGILWVAARGRVLSAYNGASWQEVGQEGTQRPTNVSALALTADGTVWAAEPGKGLWRLQGDLAELLTDQDGLASAQITALAVDVQGALWVATAKGLSRFDGDAWQTWTTQEGLPANELTALATGSNAAGQSVVWISTAKGAIARFDGDAWTVFGAAEGLPETRPSSIAADGEGVWLSYTQTRLGGERQLAHYDGATWQFYTAAQGLPAADIVTLLDDQGWLWVGTDGLGLARYADGIWTTWSGAAGLASNRVTALAADGQGVLWIGTDAGLTRLDTALLD